MSPISPRAAAGGAPAPAPPPLVTVDLWRVPARRVGGALGRVALGHARLRRVPGLRFARLVGTGAPGSFSPLDAEPRRWGLVAVWDDGEAAQAFAGSATARSWERAADERFHVELRPVAWRGRWSGREPFGPAPARPGPAAPPSGPSPAAAPNSRAVPSSPARGDSAVRVLPTAAPGLVAVLTRARLAPRRAVAFWRAAPPVAADLADLAATAGSAGPSAAGPLLAIGIGEAPIGLQGTFSVWPDLAAVRAFAYRRPAHAAVVSRTAEVGWYAEELFARFAVLTGHGTVDGRDPLHR
jgi:hypothetical protein